MAESEQVATPSGNITHEPPSMPNSPDHKRTKRIDPTPGAASIAGTINTQVIGEMYSKAKALSLATVELFQESNRATPTPIAMASHPAPSATSDEVPSLQVQLLSPKGRAPTRGSAFAAGYDLYSSEDTTVPARGKAMVATDISIAVPAGTCASLPLRDLLDQGRTWLNQTLLS
jgi:dUTP pyrophosphatase